MSLSLLNVCVHVRVTPEPFKCKSTEICGLSDRISEITQQRFDLGFSHGKELKAEVKASFFSLLVIKKMWWTPKLTKATFSLLFMSSVDSNVCDSIHYEYTQQCNFNAAIVYKWFHVDTEATDGNRSWRSVTVFEESSVKFWLIWREARAFKSLPLRPWLWMTFFFGVAAAASNWERIVCPCRSLKACLKVPVLIMVTKCEWAAATTC